MELSPETVESLASEYDQLQPFAAVESEHRELLPETLPTGEFGWRDAEWVVQWYYRRFLGTYLDRDRRAREESYGENSYEAVQTTMFDAATAADTPAKIDALTRLSGVDVGVASAFLQFIHPTAHLALSEREWRVLERAGILHASYPTDPTVETYEQYRSACNNLADDAGVDLWTVYRAIWTCWARTDVDDHPADGKG